MGEHACFKDLIFLARNMNRHSMHYNFDMLSKCVYVLQEIILPRNGTVQMLDDCLDLVDHIISYMLYCLESGKEFFDPTREINRCHKTHVVKSFEKLSKQLNLIDERMVSLMAPLKRSDESRRRITRIISYIDDMTRFQSRRDFGASALLRRQRRSQLNPCSSRGNSSTERGIAGVTDRRTQRRRPTITGGHEQRTNDTIHTSRNVDRRSVPFESLFAPTCRNRNEILILRRLRELQIPTKNFSSKEKLQKLQFLLAPRSYSNHRDKIAAENISSGALSLFLNSVECILNNAIDEITKEKVYNISQLNLSSVKGTLASWTAAFVAKTTTTNSWQTRLIKEKNNRIGNLLNFLDGYESNSIANIKDFYPKSLSETDDRVEVEKREFGFMRCLTTECIGGPVTAVGILQKFIEKMECLAKLNFLGELSEKFVDQLLTVTDYVLSHAKWDIVSSSSGTEFEPLKAKFVWLRNFLEKVERKQLSNRREKAEDKSMNYSSLRNRFDDFISSVNSTNQSLAEAAADLQEPISALERAVDTSVIAIHRWHSNSSLNYSEILTELDTSLTRICSSELACLEDFKLPSSLNHQIINVLLNLIKDKLKSISFHQINELDSIDIHIFERLIKHINVFTYVMLEEVKCVTDCHQIFYTGAQVAMQLEILHDTVSEMQNSNRERAEERRRQDQQLQEMREHLMSEFEILFSVIIIEQGSKFIKNLNEDDPPSTIKQKLESVESVGVLLESLPERCSICLCDMPRDVNFGIIDNCSHFHCSPCIEEWLKNSYSCPNCRANISSWTSREYFEAYLASKAAATTT